MQTSNSRVDVIVPCYRYGHLLRQCVRSVLDGQNGVNVQVLIIDDASPDETEKVGRALAREDSRVEYWRHQSNRGHLITFNEGLAWASGEYALLLSADDMVTPGALRRAACLMDSDPRIGFVWGQAITLRDDEAPPETVHTDDDFPARVQNGQDFLRHACTTGDNIVLTPTVIVRNKLQKELGGYRSRLTHAGDFEMWMRFAAHGDVGYLDGAQAYYRLHGQNMSGNYSLIGDIEQRKLAFDEVFERHGRHIDDAESLYRMAMRSLAGTAFWTGSHLFDRGDLDGCRRFHELSVQVDPSIRRSGMWRRFALKRVVGPGVWRALRPLVWKMKGKAA